jgi:phytoene dehydrogenase-like protein
MSKKVNIIGGGITGLCAGCYLQMNGYETEIFELNAISGGLCTAWKRKGYTFDGCVHWLVGSGPGEPLFKMWNEVMDMSRIQFVDHEEFFRVEDEKGNTIRVFTDLNRLEKELLDKAPEDARLIREFIGSARNLLSFRMPSDQAPEVMGFGDVLRMLPKLLPHLGQLKKWSRISMGEYASRCKNPLLANMFEGLFSSSTVMLFGIMTLAWMHLKTAGYPIGGSFTIAQAIEKTYLELGGRIRFGAKVREIVVENGKASGVVLENGEKIGSDIVISAADGHDTLYRMLGGRFIDKKTKDLYENYEIFPSFIQVSLGLDRTFEEPHVVSFPLEKSIVLDPETKLDRLRPMIYLFDPTLAPKGKTSVAFILPTRDYRYWTNLRSTDPNRYKAEKKRIADEVVAAMEKRFGNFKSKVEVTDVSTPATVIRYTNNWKGSFEGWLYTSKMGFRRISKTLPGLENFYMAGQWVEPGGGLPTAVMSGRNVTQIICKKDGIPFKTTSQSEASCCQKSS